jgi:hypothetical protein
MRKFIILFICALSINSFAQDKRESEIRRLEELERIAVLVNDTISLFNDFWAPNMKVNIPANTVADVAKIRQRIRTDKLKYASFERIIEDITFDENIAIVMGYEKLVPKGHADDAGKLLTRRFTNIWKYTKKDKWKMIARQATIIKVE